MHTRNPNLRAGWTSMAIAGIALASAPSAPCQERPPSTATAAWDQGYSVSGPRAVLRHRDRAAALRGRGRVCARATQSV